MCGSATVYSNLGYAYYGNKQYPEAMDAFGKALALDPEVFTQKGGVGAILQQRTAPDPGDVQFSAGEVLCQDRRCRACRALPEAFARLSATRNFARRKKIPNLRP